MADADLAVSCTFPSLDVRIGQLDVEGESSGEGVEGIKKLLVPRKGEDPDPLFSGIGVGVGEFLGQGGPNCAFEPLVAKEQPLNQGSNSRELK